MATGWTPITSGSGGAGEILGGVDKLGADGCFEPMRASLIALAFAQWRFGGARGQSAIGAVYADVPNWSDFILPDAKYAGFTWTALVELRCFVGTTTIRARVRNITDSTTAIEGAIVSATTWTKESLVWVPTVGKVYRLQVLKSNDDDDCFVWANVQRTV